VHDAVDVAIISPFAYGFTMVALGHLAIYHRINRDRDCPGIADRVFVYEPLADESFLLRPSIELEAHLPTFERRIPLRDTRLICISLTNPDGFTVAHTLLAAGGVPPLCADRAGGDYPLILAGGPGCCNPEPFAGFVDLFCIGDGAELTAKVVHAVHRLRRLGQPATAEGVREVLGDVPGLYVPSLYRFEYAGPSVTRIEPLQGAPMRVEPATDPPQISGLTSLVSDGETAVIVPNYGCKHHCSYCQISEINYRETSIAPLLLQVDRYLASGVRTLIVNSATITQHTEVEELLSSLADLIESCGREVKVYIGSVRFDEVSPLILAGMGRINAFSHTYLLYTGGSPARFMALAPEHGSRDLLRRMNRPIDPWRILGTVELAAKENIHHFVLYYIVGIESETSEDRDQISALTAEILDRVEIAGGGVILKINPLIPTPGTACQRMPMPTFADYQLYLGEVADGIVRRVGRVRFDRQVQMVSLLEERLTFEAVVNRADRRIVPLIDRFARSRARGEEPSDLVLQGWFEEVGLSQDNLTSGRGPEEILPWQVVDRTKAVAEQRLLTTIHGRAEP
jgi:radical SAM superfamily enzyme YgiQ (UPF0313 family)